MERKIKTVECRTCTHEIEVGGSGHCNACLFDMHRSVGLPQVQWRLIGNNFDTTLRRIKAI